MTTSELDTAIAVARMQIICAVNSARFFPKFDTLEPPAELTGAAKERFREAQRDKRREHYRACVKAEREFVEAQLRDLCEVAAEMRPAVVTRDIGDGRTVEYTAFVFGDDWTPTSENINALPEPIRRFIHDIETNADPAQTVRENTLLKDTVAALEKRTLEQDDLIKAYEAQIEKTLGLPEGKLAEIAEGLLGKFREPDAGVTATRIEGEGGGLTLRPPPWAARGDLPDSPGMDEQAVTGRRPKQPPMVLDEDGNPQNT